MKLRGEKCSTIPNNYILLPEVAELHPDTFLKLVAVIDWLYPWCKLCVWLCNRFEEAEAEVELEELACVFTKNVPWLSLYIQSGIFSRSWDPRSPFPFPLLPLLLPFPLLSFTFRSRPCLLLYSRLVLTVIPYDPLEPLGSNKFNRLFTRLQISEKNIAENSEKIDVSEFKWAC